MSTWTVRARIGADTFTQQRDPEEEPTLPVLYAVQWSHELDIEDDAWPVPEALTTATVTVLLAQASDAEDWDPTTTVHLEFLADAAATTVVDSFTGRGSFPVLEPHPLGALATITVVSYLMDLDAYLTGAAIMPAEEVDARLNREMGWGLGGQWADLAARAANPVTLLELTRSTLAYGASQTELNPALPDKWRIHELTAETDPLTGELDPVLPWGILQLDVDTYSSAPLVLRANPDAPGTWELWADPDEPATADAVIDANHVAMGARWGRAIGAAVNTIHVKMADGTFQTATSAAPGDPVVAYTVETDLATASEGLAIAQMLLPQPAEEGVSSPWEADAFTVLLDDTPDGWYPRPLREVMALGRIPREWHPTGSTYFLGIITRRELQVAQGTATVSVKLEGRLVLSPGPPDTLTIDEVPQTIDSLTDTINNFGNSRSV